MDNASLACKRLIVSTTTRPYRHLVPVRSYCERQRKRGSMAWVVADGMTVASLLPYDLPIVLQILSDHAVVSKQAHVDKQLDRSSKSKQDHAVPPKKPRLTSKLLTTYG
eukprot:6526-Amphidinium_carterae.1